MSHTGRPPILDTTVSVRSDGDSTAPLRGQVFRFDRHRLRLNRTSLAVLTRRVYTKSQDGGDQQGKS